MQCGSCIIRAEAVMHVELWGILASYGSVFQGVWTLMTALTWVGRVLESFRASTKKKNFRIVLCAKSGWCLQALVVNVFYMKV